MGTGRTLQQLTGVRAAVAAAGVLVLAGWAPDRDSAVAGWSTLHRADGTVARAYGAGIAAPRCATSPRAAERAARAFVDEHTRHIAPSSRPDDFAVSSNSEHGGLRVVSFQQQSGGVAVLGAGLAVYCKRDRVFAVALSIDSAPAVPALPLDTPDGASETAIAHISRDGYAGVRARGVDGPWVRGADTVYRVDVDADAPLGRFHAFVDVTTGAVIDVESMMRHAEGTVLYRTPTRHPGDDPVDHPAATVALTVDGVDTMTDGDGLVSWPTAVDATVEPTTAGAYADVVDEFLSGPSTQLTLPPGGSAVWAAPADPALSAARIVYIHIMVARERALELAPDLPWLDEVLDASVNATGLCNAASTGDDILFFRSGDNGLFACQNAGAIVDLVYHEYAHSLHFQSIVPNAGKWDPALTEGLADYFAASLTGDPGWARGFLYGDKPWRHIDPSWFEVVHPDDVNTGNSHWTGRIVSGALWDLRAQLMDDLGASAGRDHADALMYQVMRLSDSIVTVYAEVLAADDDDGDLSNGTPNQCAIDIAFARHGLGDASAPVQPRPPTRAGRDVTLPISGSASACATNDVDTAYLEWYLRDQPDTNGSVLMTTDGDGPNLVARLPEVPDDTVVRYRVIAEMTETKAYELPDNPADPYYEAYFGPTAPIYCTGFVDADVVGAWDHDWDWLPPDGENGTGNPRKAHTPTFVLGTDSGRGNADGLYGPNQSLHARSPSIDTEGYPTVRLQYYRWLDVEDGHFDRAAITANGATVWTNLDSDMGDASETHHQDREWRFHDIDLTDHVVDGHVQVELTLDTDATNHFAGWNIDTLCIMGIGVPVRTDDAGPGPTADAAPAAGTDAGGLSPGPGGCGCRSGDEPAIGWLFVLAVAFVTNMANRRRRATRDHRRRRCRAARARSTPNTTRSRRRSERTRVVRPT